MKQVIIIGKQGCGKTMLKNNFPNENVVTIQSDCIGEHYTITCDLLIVNMNRLSYNKCLRMISDFLGYKVVRKPFTENELNVIAEDKWTEQIEQAVLNFKIWQKQNIGELQKDSPEKDPLSSICEKLDIIINKLK